MWHSWLDWQAKLSKIRRIVLKFAKICGPMGQTKTGPQAGARKLSSGMGDQRITKGLAIGVLEVLTQIVLGRV